MGIGEACARHLAAEGAPGLLLFDRDPLVHSVAADIQRKYSGCRAIAMQGDSAREEDCVRAIQTAHREFGRLDGLVNAAGVTTRGSLESTTVAMWDSILNINLRGPFIFTREAAKVMRCGGRGGAVVNISSVHAHGGGPEHFAYGTSKAGLNYITKHSAGELMDAGIRLNAINVGWCVTPTEDQLQRKTGGVDWVAKAERTYPTGKLLSPVDVAVTAGYLVSDAAARVWDLCRHASRTAARVPPTPIWEGRGRRVTPQGRPRGSGFPLRAGG